MNRSTDSTRRFRLASLLGIGLLLAGCHSGESSLSAFKQDEFKNPSNTFRAVPFYSLNDRLEAGEITRQIGLMKEAGYGGAFLHSRIGLLTPYLGQEWFEMMEAGTRALQANGMDVWYYDEDKWPSGFAGGIVPRANPDFQARSLIRLPKGFLPQAPDTILCEDQNWVYVCRVNPMGQPRYNGTSWVDLLNPAVTELFIESSYVPYVERFKGQPGVRGMFTDEPNVFPRPERAHDGAISYSPVLDSVFEARCGYALTPIIPALFDTVDDWRKVRLDYYRTVAHCFEEAFSKPIGAYCAEQGWIWTGHYNGEDTPALTMRNTGNLMQQLRHMQQPGLDALALRFNTIYSAKGVTSVANQYGRQRRLCELFGIGGHNMSFEDRIWITAWNSIMGINFMCPHLYLYSMRGERKRDYPPAISHQQPYWSENKLFEDYSARLCYFGSVGRTVAEVCVIHPQESSYLDFQTDMITPTGVQEPILETLLEAHRNFDFGDEQILSEIGHVKNGRLSVGEMNYGAVVIPPLKTIRPATIALLSKFALAGGKVLLCGDYPAFVDGERDEAALSSLRSCSQQVSVEKLSEALEQALAPRFSLSGPGAGEIWSLLRENSNGLALQLSNTSRTETRTLTLNFSEKSPVALWNPINGECLRLTPEASGGFTLQFAPAQSWIVTTGKSARKANYDGQYSLPRQRESVLALGGEWDGRRLDPNAITLDCACFSTDGGRSWNPEEPVLAFSDRTAHKEPYNGPLQIRYTVQVDTPPQNASLVVEQPRIYNSIRVNGTEVDFSNSDFWLDRSFRKQAVTALLKPGENEIILSLDFRSAVIASYDATERYGTEIESIYLVGDFGVKATEALEPLRDSWRNRGARLQPKAPVNRFKSFALSAEKTVFEGDLTTQGYPFYAGRFELSRTFSVERVDAKNRYFLTFPAFEATLIGVEVNGKTFQPLFASPWEVDVTEALRPGENEVTLLLTNTLRNLMGPHHHRGGEFTEVRPVTFRASTDVSSTVKEPTGEEDWYDARRRGNPVLWRDYYHMIPFGLLGEVTLEKTTR